jgi:hypothetical protein
MDNMPSKSAQWVLKMLIMMLNAAIVMPLKWLK